MPAPRPTFIMLRTGRFEDVQAQLNGRLTVLDAGYGNARRHVVRNDGWGGFLRLLMSAPPAHSVAMAQANAERKQARLGRVFRDGSLAHRVYVRHKARHAQLAERLIRDRWADTENPVGLVYNGTNVPDSVLQHVAPDGQRLFIENGYFSGTVQIDNAGINGFNSLPRDPAFYMRYVPRKVMSAPALHLRKAKHAAHASEPLPPGTIFVPFQVDSDMQITRLSPWVRSMRHFHAVLCDTLDRLPGQHVVIKEHPMTRRALCGKVPAHPRILFQNGRPTSDLIAEAAGVVTINSTVGIESLALGKPTVLLGQACFAVPGLVRQAGSVEALAGVLRDLPTWTPDPVLRDRFLSYLRHEFLFGDEGFPIDDTLPDRLAWLLSRRHADMVPRDAGIATSAARHEQA